jgi:hypothetical protein
MLPDEQASPRQLEVLRSLSGERRLRLAERLYWAAREMTCAGVRTRHPEWPEDRVQAEARRTFLDARD